MSNTDLYTLNIQVSDKKERVLLWSSLIRLLGKLSVTYTKYFRETRGLSGQTQLKEPCVSVPKTGVQPVLRTSFVPTVP